MLDAQDAFGSDILMVLDVCPAYPCERTELLAERCCRLPGTGQSEDEGNLLLAVDVGEGLQA